MPNDPIDYAGPSVSDPLPPRWQRVLAWTLIFVAIVLFGLIAYAGATTRMWH
jgi:hypothetical protein